MKEPNEDIRKLFSDFEPEVRNDKVQEGWEKMAYFLPREKKRRFGFYLPGCAALLCLLLGGLASYFMFYKNNAPGISTVKSKTLTSPKTVTITPGDHKSNQSSTSLKPVAPQVRANAPSQKQVQPNTVRKNKTMQQAVVPAHVPVKIIAMLPAKDKKQIKQLPLNNTLIDPAVNEDKEENTTDDNTFRYKNSPGLKILKKESDDLPVYLPSRLPDFVKQDTNIETSVVEIPRPARTFMHPGFRLQVFAGPTFVATTVNDLAYDIKQTNNKVSVSAGVALSYQFINRVSVIGQFVASQSKLNYTQESSQRIDITNYSITSATPTPKKYIDLFTTRTLASSSGYNIALGLGYPVYQRGRMGITAFALINARQVKYTYTERQVKGTDTLSMPSTGITGPLATLSGLSANPTNTMHVLRTTCIIPGLFVEYKLNRRLTVIARPSYYLQLTGNNGRFNNQLLVKQNVFYLDFGIQLKW